MMSYVIVQYLKIKFDFSSILSRDEQRQQGYWMSENFFFFFFAP